MTRTPIRILALALLALWCMLLLAPFAQAREQCKPYGPQYIHAVEQRPNWAVYWWCDYKTIDWFFYLPGQETTERLVAGVQWYWGLRPGYLDEPPWGDPAVLEQMRQGVMAIAGADANRPPKPPTAQWWVQSNGSTPTRPSYPVIDGKRGTTSDGRAPVGAACDCSSAIVEGKTTYCRFAAAGATAAPSTSVAVCSQVAPAGSTGTAPAAAPPTAAPPTKAPAAGVVLKTAQVQ